MVYISDDEVFEQQKRARKLTQQLNTMDRADFDGIKKVVKELFAKSEDAFVNPPFYCDYGYHIEVGKNFFANYNCTILDVGMVRIGDNCQMAPNVAIYTAGHPVHPADRNSLYEYGIDVTIGDNVWLGGNVVMCGCVGSDSFGREAIESFVKEGIDVSSVRVVDNVPSGTAVIIVVDGDNRIILDKGANGYLTREDVDKVLEKASEGDVYLTQLENPIDVIGYGLKKAKEKGLFVILNPAPANVDILPYIRYCDVITPNETESAVFGGKEELLKVVPTVITTLGGDGFEIATNSGAKRYPCIKITPVDTTAAGDTLCGGLAARIAAGETLENAAKFGSVAASLACTKKGAQPSIPSREAVVETITNNYRD